MALASAFACAWRAVVASLMRAGFSPVAVAEPALTWNELTPLKSEALAPLAGEWDTLDADRKRKWLEVAAKYPNLSARRQADACRSAWANFRS